ncbi:DUF1223 domain-containing protein [Croceitalea sp. MTPC5]|uniref:DUF1223 domain-containing protein n=1 Tax=Croceitalea sp. MTPC5 TaxID=3056565 RepID=UPI002B373A4D|nr:DUF1223 domain-containing protein [Croceitalea sp. MTPC5]
MYKKIIIPIVIFVGLTTTAFYTMNEVENAKNGEEKPVLGEYDAVVVLELFTSQGCSSCPPADVLLDKAKKDFPEKVFALSYHVDYWNYIGWEDPFSKSTFSKKQRAYNQKFKSRSNYTPQLVVNGKEHFVGSNGYKLDTKIQEYGKQKVINDIQLSNIKENGRSITFDYTVKGTLNDKQLRAVLVLDERTTAVKRGENRSRVLKNANVVIAEKYIPLNTARGTSSLTIPSLASASDDLTLILVIENKETDITGAVKSKV